MVPNENNEIIPKRLVTSWHICMDYKKLNAQNEEGENKTNCHSGQVGSLEMNCKYYCY